MRAFLGYTYGYVPRKRFVHGDTQPVLEHYYCESEDYLCQSRNVTESLLDLQHLPNDRSCNCLPGTECTKLLGYTNYYVDVPK